MAVIQPYFDPTVRVQGGSAFTRYLEGFMKERSATNKRIMEQYLSRTDPKFLHQEQLLIRRNINELLAIKAKAEDMSNRGKQQLMVATRRGVLNVISQQTAARGRMSEKKVDALLENRKMELKYKSERNESIQESKRGSPGSPSTFRSQFGNKKGQEILDQFLPEIKKGSGKDWNPRKDQGSIGGSIPDEAAELRLMQEIEKALLNTKVAPNSSEKKNLEATYQLLLERNEVVPSGKGKFDASSDLEEKLKQFPPGYESGLGVPGLGQPGDISGLMGEMPSDATFDSAEIDAQLKSLRAEYDKLTERIEEARSGDASAGFGPFQVNYMWENMFVRDPRDRGLYSGRETFTERETEAPQTGMAQYGLSPTPPELDFGADPPTYMRSGRGKFPPPSSGEQPEPPLVTSTLEPKVEEEERNDEIDFYKGDLSILGLSPNIEQSLVENFSKHLKEEQLNVPLWNLGGFSTELDIANPNPATLEPQLNEFLKKVSQSLLVRDIIEEKFKDVDVNKAEKAAKKAGYAFNEVEAYEIAVQRSGLSKEEKERVLMDPAEKFNAFKETPLGKNQAMQIERDIRKELDLEDSNRE